MRQQHTPNERGPIFRTGKLMSLRKVILEQWDTISVPPGVSRGFRNVSSEAAYLMGMASGKDPGMINWPDQVRAAALAVGIVLP